MRVATRTAVVTVVAGRHHHLRAQQRSLVPEAPDLAVVVAMGDPEVPGIVHHGPLSGTTEVHVVDVPVADALPLAAARNAGAACAVEAGAELLVFLDVDCLAGPGLLDAYADASRRLAADRLTVLSGPVAYLAELEPGRTAYDAADLARADPHRARPAPDPGVLVRADDLRLFWSLSFAVRAGDWQRFGGFDEAYTGYGGEDTDFGQRVAEAGGSLWWVGGANAYHQWHPVSAPPVEHLDDVVRNANLFHRRWGWFPMQGWLDAFREQGLAQLEEGGDQWLVTSATHASTR